tara:strand:- start:775 stop:1728 length:954 start_codon:yes stop_codon:yes gene_type:complete
MDYRKKENREEAFKIWCAWSIIHKDCDPALWLLNYLFERYEHNIEQKYWISWIYGTTYNLPTAWIIWNEFPDFHLVDQKRLEDWNTKNYKILRYQTDTKYNKGYLPKQFESYKKWVSYKNEDNTQNTRFQNLLIKNNFNFVWNTVSKNLYKFGRYSTWYYLQTLNECVGLDINPNNLKLSDYSGSKSHRNGLCYALGLDEWVNKKLDKDCINYLEQEALRIMNELPEKVNYYQMETMLCSFKKIFRKSRGRYLGYYLDRQAEEIIKVQQDGWQGIDWHVFWQGREEILEEKLYKSKNIRKELYSIYLDTGTLEYKSL